MSKKKPFSRIENGKTLRSIAFESKKFYSGISDGSIGDLPNRLKAEELELRERMVKLDDFLYVKETSDSETAVSKEAMDTGAESVKLLKRQLKAMREYHAALVKRVELAKKAAGK